MFSRLGIDTNDTLIVYDDNGLCKASRLWWILQNYNFKNIKLLHGGLSEWKASNGQVTNELPVVTETEFRLTDRPMMKYYVLKEKMNRDLLNNTVILDTRSMDKF